jgi:hypothetical protein
MAKTVGTAFAEFNKDYVNLIADRTTKARSSRDWLINQLVNLPNKIDDFPKLFDNMSLKFGSFARNTKIIPLDDVDLLLAFSADGTTYTTHIYGQNYSLNVLESAKNLRKLCNDDYTLNSIKVVNKIVNSLNQIEHYKKAKIHRRQEAATLQLDSYEWNFDIVPALHTDTNYYLIPDGSGGWKATDPRIDQKRVNEINQKHNGRILQIIRTLKYWNKRPNMPTISSYFFENLILDYFNSKSETSTYIDVNLIKFWHHLQTAIYNSYQDPKGFQGELNNLTIDEKSKIATKASDAYKIGFEAYNAETKESDQEKAINKWRDIFGDSFPKYE